MCYRRSVSAGEEEDEWVFDTIKPSTLAMPKHTQKRRRLSRIPSGEEKPPEELFQQLTLNETPLGTIATPPINVRKNNDRRRSSAATANTTPSGATAFTSSSGGTAKRILTPTRAPSTARRTSGHGQKQPLALDMSFGNGNSTTRLFRRVSDQSLTVDCPADVDERNENRPPAQDAVTKEALLGRKAFTKAVEPAFREIYAQTSSQSHRDAISRLANAWTALDAVDPGGEYLLLKTVIEKIQR